MATPEDLLAKAAARKAAENAKKGIASPEQAEQDRNFFETSLGDVKNTTEYPQTQSDKDIDQIVKSLTVEEAYKTFIPGKSWSSSFPGAKKGEIQFRCPHPDHVDKVPSASWNTIKNAWVCYGCLRKGDALDIAAIGLNYDLNTYKDGINFVNLRTDIAAAFGYVKAVRLPGQREDIYVRTEPEPGPPPPAPPTKTVEEMMGMTGAKLAPVREISTAPSAPEPELTAEEAQELDFDADPDNNFKFPVLKWREFLPEGSFLYEYMNATSVLPYPDEYDFWNAMLGVSFILGRDVYFEDIPNVYGNLFICTVGRTGEGKSQASRVMREVLREVMPYVADDPGNKGVKQLATPNSLQFFINEFSRLIPDPFDPKVEHDYPVKGLVEFSEMIALMAKLRGPEGGLFQAALLKFYDADDLVTSGAIVATRAAIDSFCQVTSTTQLKEIKNLLTESDAASGLLNRFIFSMGPSRERSLMLSRIKYDIEPAKRKYQELKSFWALYTDGVGITLSPEAEELFERLWRERGVPAKAADSTDLMSRLDLTMKKIVLLLAANAKLTVITPTIITQSFAVFDYLVASYQGIGARIGISRQSQMEQRVKGVVERYSIRHPGKNPTLREIKLLTKGMSEKELKQILEILCANQYLELIPPPAVGTKGGRPSARYRNVS